MISTKSDKKNFISGRAWDKKILLITDNNLGDVANSIITEHATDYTWIKWNSSDKKSKDELLYFIRNGEWDLAISFYSDLVLSKKCLETIFFPINIHPALPLIRGVGHDVVPLIENHTFIGATLHLMEETIDAGQIYHVLVQPRPNDIDYHSLRALNQKNSVLMLNYLCELISSTSSIKALREKLEISSNELSLKWGSTYFSKKTVMEIKGKTKNFNFPEEYSVPR